MSQTDVADEKTLPHNRDLEQVVLGCTLLHPETYLEKTQVLEIRDFHQEQHRHIFKAVQEVTEDGDDPSLPLIADNLREKDLLEGCGGAQYLDALLNEAVPASFDRAIAKVQEYARARLAVQYLEQYRNRLYDNPSDVDTLLADTQDTLRTLEPAPIDEIPEHATAAEMKEIIGRQEWLWKKWLPKGHISLMLSRQGVGKSTLALWLQLTVAGALQWPDGQENDEPGSTIHLEAEGFHGGHADRLRQWGVAEEFEERIILLGEGGLDTADLHSAEQRSQVQALIREYGAKLVVLDALRRALKGDENESRVSEVLSPWQELAREEDVPLLVLHHMGKGFKGDREPELDDLRGSSAIGDICRSAIGLWNPDPNRPDAVTAVQLKPSLISVEEAKSARFSYEWDEGGLDFDIDEPKPPQGSKTKKEQAKSHILEMLEKEPKPRQEIVEAAEGWGLSERTVDRAASDLRGRQITTVYADDGSALWGLLDKHHEGV